MTERGPVPPEQSGWLASQDAVHVLDNTLLYGDDPAKTGAPEGCASVETRKKRRRSGRRKDVAVNNHSCILPDSNGATAAQWGPHQFDLIEHRVVQG